MASPSPEAPPDTNSTASAPPPKISPATGHTGSPSSHLATLPNPNNKGLATSARIGITTLGVFCFSLILVICFLGYLLCQQRKKRHESFRRMPRHQDDMPDGILQHQQQSPARLTRIVLGCRDFSREELAEATDGFSNLLGEGGFGHVYKGCLPKRQFIAVKKRKPGSLQGEREFQAEVDAISRVHHKYLVTLIGYCTSDGETMLVYEFVPNNTLKYHLHGEGIPSMDWSTRMKIAIGSAKGLEYLHVYCNPIIIHRDIKASNILLDEDFEPKVADFGLAKFLSDTESHVSTRVMGTDGYVDPEYADSRRLTVKSDVYSFGVVLLELITGRKPDKILDLVKKVRHLLSEALKNGKFDGLVDPRLQNYKAEEMIRMIACAEACVLDEAKHRPEMRQVVLVLEGTIPLEDLKAGIIPGPRNVSDSFDDGVQYNEDLKKTLKGKEKDISEYSGPSSKYGQHPSVSTAGHSNVSEYSFNDSVQSNEYLKKTFMNMTLKVKEKVISEYSGPSSQYGHHPSVSTHPTRSGQQNTQEMEMGKVKGSNHSSGMST